MLLLLVAAGMLSGGGVVWGDRVQHSKYTRVLTQYMVNLTLYYSK